MRICWGWALALAVSVLAVPAAAQQIQGIRIHMHASEGYAADGLLFEPAGQEPFPVIILIPDPRGLTKRVTDAAARLAESGYVAVAVDLNRGLSPEEATHSQEQAAHDLDAAMNFINGQSNIRRGRVGALGWGSGGIYAMRLAAESGVRAVAIDDAALPDDLTRLVTLRAPLLVSFAGSASVSISTVKAFEEHMRALKNTVDAKTYPQAASGFDDPEDAAHYRPKDAADVWRREQQFFAAHLAR
jgi:carboxymethylenebutenolidase